MLLKIKGLYQHHVGSRINFQFGADSVRDFFVEIIQFVYLPVF